MATQQNPVQYGKAIQWQLSSIAALNINWTNAASNIVFWTNLNNAIIGWKSLPIPVYAAFNRNFATQPRFLVWTLRNVHQPVYTGSNQSNKGIDRPIFQISIFTQNIEDGFTISNQILQSLHGYSGLFGGATDGFWIAKADVDWLYNSYDNENKLAEIFLDCTLDIPT